MGSPEDPSLVNNVDDLGLGYEGLNKILLSLSLYLSLSLSLSVLLSPLGTLWRNSFYIRSIRLDAKWTPEPVRM